MMKLSLAGSSSTAPKKNGISLSKPKAPSANDKGKGKSTAFGNDDDEDEDNDESAPLPSALKNRTLPTANASKRLAKMHSSAQEVDPSIFAYDEVYDSMKLASQAALDAKRNAKDNEADKPKYVSNLLKAAELRKKDRVRAEDKLIEREREKEGDEFKDKDAFVTMAYKEQQEELRKAEEEERIQEEQAAKRPGGMAAYYEKELAQREAIHAAAVAASQSLQPSTSTSTSTTQSSTQLSAEAAELAAHGPKSEAVLAAEASAALGRNIQLNTEGQIVDKRELLKGGLNRKPVKPVQGPSAMPGNSGFALSISERKSAAEEVALKEKERKEREDKFSLELHGMSAAERLKASRERQSKEMERQLMDSRERKRVAEEEKEKEIQGKRVKRNNDESKVEEMKRRAAERRMKAKLEAAQEMEKVSE